MGTQTYGWTVHETAGKGGHHGADRGQTVLMDVLQALSEQYSQVLGAWSWL